MVVAQEWPRLERNCSEGVQIIETCQCHGVLLAFVKGNDIDATTTAGRLVADFMSSMARHDIEVKGERQSRAQRQRAEQGRAPKGVRASWLRHKRPCHPGRSPHGQEDLHGIRWGLFAPGDSCCPVWKDQPEFARRTCTPPAHVQAMLERNEKRAEENQHRTTNEQLEMRSGPEVSPWPASMVLGILRTPSMPTKAPTRPRRPTPTAIGAALGALQSSERTPGSPSRRTQPATAVPGTSGADSETMTMSFWKPGASSASVTAKKQPSLCWRLKDRA